MMAEASAEPSHPLLERLFERLASKDGVHFKHQTRDEPDLTTSEKMGIAREMYLKSPARFLARFHQHLVPEDAVCFAGCADDYEVSFYLRQIAERNVERVQRNRRYTAMGRLLKEGDYFSESSMRERDPELYEELVGRYDSEAAPTPGYRSFAEFLLRSLDSNEKRRCVPELMEVEDEEDEDVEEFDTDDDEEENGKLTASCSEEEDKEDIGSEVERTKEKKEKEEEGEEEDEMAEDARAAMEEAQKALYRQEFLAVMKERFMRGEDEDFDYDALNADLSLDDQEENDRDMEERYFDEEEPATPRTASSLSSSEPGPTRAPPAMEVEASAAGPDCGDGRDGLTTAPDA